MGDRGNIVVQEAPGKRVYLYTHWSGSEIGDTVKTALAKRWRWDDPAYLGRIIFDTLTKGQQGNETGYGISTGICDNEHPIIVVDCASQSVWFEDDKGNETKKKPVSFADFIK